MDRAIPAQEALKLPAWQRVEIIDALWRSLVPAEQASVDQAWLEESHERLAAYHPGELPALHGETTLRPIEGRLGQ